MGYGPIELDDLERDCRRRIEQLLTILVEL